MTPLPPKRALTLSSACLLLVSLEISAQVSVSMLDYFPADPSQFCTRTRTYTYGKTGSDTVRIAGTIRVPYKSGTVTGIVVDGGGEPGDGVLAYAIEGSNVIFIVAGKDPDGNWLYVSRDCQMSGPPPFFVLGTVTDGMIWTTNVAYAVTPSGACFEIDDFNSEEYNLLRIQRITVGGVAYDNAVVVWDLSNNNPYATPDFKGRDRLLGLQVPTLAETQNRGINGFSILARGLGPIAGGNLAWPGVLGSEWQVTAMDCTTPNPSVFDGGVVNAASFASGQPIAPGMLVAIYGFDLARITLAANAIPLPTRLDDVQVTFNGILASLHAIIAKGSGNPAQINAQVPWNVLTQGGTTGTAAVIVRRGSVASPPLLVQVGPFSPGVFAYPYGVGQAIAVLQTNDERNAALAAPRNSIAGIKTLPSTAGDYIQVYATGHGAVDIPIASGYNAIDQIRRTATPTVLIGGVPAEVTFAGLSPWFVGVNQVNVRIPPSAPKGSAVPLQLQIGGITTTDRVTIAIE